MTVVGHIIPGTDSEPRSLQIWDADRLQLHDKDAAPPLVQTVKLFAPKFPEAPVGPRLNVCFVNTCVAPAAAAAVDD